MPNISKVPSFDGRLDPQAYIDCQLSMDRYFVGVTCLSIGKFDLP